MILQKKKTETKQKRKPLIASWGNQTSEIKTTV